eukprot:349171-Karenia_brevis.AAC.1
MPCSGDVMQYAPANQSKDFNSQELAANRCDADARLKELYGCYDNICKYGPLPKPEHASQAIFDA